MLTFKLLLRFAVNNPIKLVLMRKFIPCLMQVVCKAQKDRSALSYTWACLEGFIHNCGMGKLKWK